MQDTNALHEQVETLRSEIADLDSAESLTDEQAARFDAALAEFDTARAAYDKAVERSEKVEAVRSLALNPDTKRESGFGAPEVIVKRNAFDNLDAVRAGLVSDEDLIARAKTAIEEMDAPQAHMERANSLVEDSYTPVGTARHILMTGSPAYRSAFAKFMRSPETFMAELDKDEAYALRTALSTTGANGGYLIPFLLDPTVILTNAGIRNSIRGISRVEVGTSNKWNGVTSAGVTAEWKTEGSAAADGSPTFAQPSITAYQADAYVLGSYEALADTNIEMQLPRLIADAKARLEGAAFTTGSGSGQPFGVVTSTTAVTASRVSPTTGGTFSAATEVYKVANAIDPRYADNVSWIANKTTLNTIRSFDVYGGSAFISNMTVGLPTVLLGAPVYETSSMTSTVTTGSNILLAGSFSEGYLIYDRVGVSLEYIPNVFDTSTGRPSGQRGFFAHWRTGADCVDPNAFRVLKL
jgi:HK97 family phage major capsid protein